MTIGTGSAAFETLRYLVERIPVMVTPAWVRTESQPLAITDVVYWLVRWLSTSGTTDKTLKIGGPDVLPYREVMRIMHDTRVFLRSQEFADWEVPAGLQNAGGVENRGELLSLYRLFEVGLQRDPSVRIVNRRMEVPS